jgi:hypothetical protein
VVYRPACESSMYPSELSGGKKKEESIYKVLVLLSIGRIGRAADFLGALAREPLAGDFLPAFFGLFFFFVTDRFACFLAVAIE